LWRVILRRFLDHRRIGHDFYKEKVEQWERKTPRSAGTRGDYYATKGAYLGQKYLELVFSRFYQRRITSEQVADFLGVKTSQLPGMEGLLFRKGMAVL
jgi:hypothetical protein